MGGAHVRSSFHQPTRAAAVLLAAKTEALTAGERTGWNICRRQITSAPSQTFAPDNVQTNLCAATLLGTCTATSHCRDRFTQRLAAGSSRQRPTVSDTRLRLAPLLLMLVSSLLWLGQRQPHWLHTCGPAYWQVNSSGIDSRPYCRSSRIDCHRQNSSRRETAAGSTIQRDAGNVLNSMSTRNSAGVRSAQAVALTAPGGASKAAAQPGVLRARGAALTCAAPRAPG